MNRAKKLQITGFTAFFLSGICAISSSVIVSVLQATYGFSFGTTGTLLSAMSIGNMVASFAAGLLPSKIGTRNTVALLCFGYFLGYLMMTASGVAAFLMLAFFIVGLAKGCTINTCTVMVGDNSPDRTRGMNIMHACYACGALICPFLISVLLVRGAKLPLIAIALLRAKAAALGIPELTQKEGSLRFALPQPDFAQVAAVCGLPKYKSRLLFSAGEKPYLALRLKKGDDVLKLAGIVLEDLAQAAGGEKSPPA